LRQRLREIIQRSGRLATCQVVTEVIVTEVEESKEQTADSENPASHQNLEAAGRAKENSELTAGHTLENKAEVATVEPHEPASLAVDAPAVADVTPTVETKLEPLAPVAEAAETLPPADTAVAIETQGEVVVEASIPAATTVTTQTPTESSPIPADPAALEPSATKLSVQASVSRRSQDREKAKATKAAKREHKKKKVEERRVKAFRDYFSYGEEIKRIPPHRVLAINRAERAKILRVKVEADIEAMHAAIDELIVSPDHPHGEYLRGCARDALARLILPGLEREVRRELTDWAETHAVTVFARNLRNLLLQQPIRQRRVLAVDPGFKSGCKLAALDQFGNVLGHDVIFLIGKPGRKEEAKTKSLAIIRKYELTVVAIGNGTACRDAEEFFADLISTDLKEENNGGQGVGYVIVNEAGASVYSTSSMGREEFPQYDATLRGAISIGRRLLDPLSELVKIEPANIGVGLYQHDVKAKHLQTSLDEVVESCVNYVGVDVNTASPALLRYVSGLNQLTARRVYEHRRERGPFRNREQLREVPGFGEATFIQAAGFLKITAGDNPLDVTWIHPESYTATTKVLERLGSSPADLTDKERVAALADQVSKVDIPALCAELSVGERPIGPLALRDILAQLARPGRDPREDLPSPVFKQGILKLEDLSAGMELNGTVLNVVDFGCFVDIGMHDSGLVHVSRLANRFIRDPHEVVAVGDIVHVWVVEVDKERRRVSLTMVAPGSERPVRPAFGVGDAAGEGAAASDRPQPYATKGEGGRRDQGRGGRRDQGPGRPQGDQAAAAGQAGPAGAGSTQTGQTGYRPQRHQRPVRPSSGGDASSGAPAAQGGQAGHGQAGQAGGRSGSYQGGQGGRQGGGQGQGGQGQGGQGQGGQGRGGQGYGGQRSGGGNRRPQGPSQPRSHEFKSKEQVSKSLTDGMKAGKEPMRTFGDLRQFFEVVTTSKKESSRKEQKKGEIAKTDKAQDNHEGIGQTEGQGVGAVAPERAAVHGAGQVAGTESLESQKTYETHGSHKGISPEVVTARESGAASDAASGDATAETADGSQPQTPREAAAKAS
jgi:uncharacterized protein